MKRTKSALEVWSIKLIFLPLRLYRLRALRNPIPPFKKEMPKRWYVESTQDSLRGTSLLACVKHPIRAWRYIVMDQPS